MTVIHLEIKSCISTLELWHTRNECMWTETLRYSFKNLLLLSCPITAHTVRGFKSQVCIALLRNKEKKNI